MALFYIYALMYDLIKIIRSLYQLLHSICHNITPQVASRKLNCTLMTEFK